MKPATNDTEVTEVTSPLAFPRAKRPLTEEEDACAMCGKPTKRIPGLWVHLTTRGTITNQQDHPHSQGYWILGSDCARKLPKGFVVRWGIKNDAAQYIPTRIGR